MPDVGPGTIGPYEIAREIGRGGMGVVYLARDTMLDRDVAIKCLPDELADDVDRLSRFQREAKTLAALNHSNIAAIHGLEERDGRQYLVLEYVPGETLDERLQRGPMSCQDAISVAIQIATAMEAAHEKGIIHRDLKPANIKFVDRTSIKVLDFGLAKALPTRESQVDGGTSVSTILAGGHSLPGAILGTPGYLSPEQARGHEVDTRTDIFSFGCILYEMLTGDIAFGGKSLGDSIASVLEHEPVWSALPSNRPASLERLLRRCLAKDRHQRLQAIGDARLDLEELAHPGAAELESPASHNGRGAGARIPWILTGVLVIAVVLLVNEKWRTVETGPARVDQVELALPAGVALGWKATSTTSLSAVGQSRLLAMTRDGIRLACTARFDNEGTSLCIKDPRSWALERIAGTVNARGPFFSPDGAFIGFLQDSTLRTIRLPDGPPHDVCRVVSTAFDATWTDEGDIIYAVDDGLWRVSDDGRSDAEHIDIVDDAGREVRVRFPHVSCDGRSLFLTAVTDTGMQAAMIPLHDNNWTLRMLFPNASDIRDVENGSLVFARAGTLLTASFGSKQPGDPVPITAAAAVHTTPGYGVVLTHFATSGAGKLVFSPAVEQQEKDALVWVERGNEQTTIATGSGRWMHPRLSPDETRVLLDIHADGGTRDLFIYDLTRNQLRQLTSKGSCFNAEWSPNDGGQTIIYCALVSQGRAAFSITTDFTNVDRTILPGQRGRWLHFSEWARDDAILFWDRQRGGTWRTSADGRGELTELMNTSANERWGVISPDGNFIAYVGDELGVMHVYVRPYPALGAEIQVSTQGGGEPLWSHDGGTLYFRHADSVYAASFESAPTVNVGLPTEVLEGKYNRGPPGHQHYDVSSDGRFLMIKEGRTARHETVRVIDNWDALVSSAGS